MTIAFTKMHGAGNDFIVIDNRSGALSLDEKQVAALCHRRFGIGADGVLLLEQPPEPGLDARMVYYNADGSRAEMCGNGARCFTAFALAHNVGSPSSLRFMTDAGALGASATDGRYMIEMTPPADLRSSFEIKLEAGTATVHYVDTGVPHVVRFVDDAGAVDIRKEGRELRMHPEFAPRGANANFVQLTSSGPLIIRTYERGVEDETLACGTGVTAAGILAHLVHGVPRPVSLRVAGGDVIEIDFVRENDRIDSVTMKGPATTVFTGTIDL